MQSLTIGVTFSVTFNAEAERAGMSNMSEWSSKLAERLKTQKTVKETKDSAFLERQRLIKAHGPSLWEEVKKQTKSHCDDLNKDMDDRIAIMEDSGRWINVSGKTAHGVRKLVAVFDVDKSLLHWRAEVTSKQYEVSSGADGKVAFYPLSDKGERLFMPPSNPQSIVEEMLDALFTGLFSDGI